MRAIGRVFERFQCVAGGARAFGLIPHRPPPQRCFLGTLFGSGLGVQVDGYVGAGPLEERSEFSREVVVDHVVSRLYLGDPRRDTDASVPSARDAKTETKRDRGTPQEVLDAFATGAATKVEAYEIVSYKSLIKLAQQLGLSDAIPLFEESLREEQETAQELEQLAELVGKRLG